MCRAVVWFLAVAVLGGCAHTTMGRKINTDAVKKFQEGKTTRTEVLAALGPPFSRSMLDQGRQEMWLYLHSESNSAVVPVPFYTYMNVQTQSETMTLTFSGDVLNKITWPGAFAPAPATQPVAAVSDGPQA